jgi:BirA family biotin operon repressor/biotin-[acetyl-CoA-carboxylase] ligase
MSMAARAEALPGDLAQALAAAAPRLAPLASSVTYFSSTASTNDVATTLAMGGQGGGAVVIADAQTAGRGRRGRTWFSPPMLGLYVSVVLHAAWQAAGGGRSDRARSLVTLAAGVALAEGVHVATGLPVDIKWPNDLLVGSRKLAGILAEAVADEAIVLGYGINIAAAAYPPELADRATSLEAELGRPVDRASVCVETLAALASRYRDLRDGRYDAILDAWRARAPGSAGRRVTWRTPAGVHTGVTAGIDADGALLVSHGDRVERLVAGEVNWA